MTRPSSFASGFAALAAAVIAAAVPAMAEDAPPAADAPPPAADAPPPTQAAPPKSQVREFHRISPNDQVPTVRAITPIDGSNVFFLNHRGQVGVAKFTPGLSPIGWEYYSEVKLNALPALAVGPGYSIVTASPEELTQAFDTDGDVELDFFQALTREWPGRDEGVSITAGPRADPYGRVVFALSPHALEKGGVAKARLMAWVPADGRLVVVTESELPIESFAIRRDGLVAARLSLPDYTDGFFLSLSQLTAPPIPPSPESASKSPAPGSHPETPLPFTLPSFIIPAELTGQDRPIQPTFWEESGVSKLLLTCPESRHLVEIVPERSGGLWQGAILLRDRTATPVHALTELEPGSLLGGGDEGFVPLAEEPSSYRIRRISLANDGIELEFSHPVDRFEAVKPENYSAKVIALGGGESILSIEPVIESDGKVVLLKSKRIDPGHVLRVVCQNLPSETGAKLLGTSAFYSVHAR